LKRRRGRERDVNYARGSWYSKHMETAVAIPLFLLWLDESQRERSSHATSDPLHHFTLSGWGEPCRRVLNAPLVAGKGLLWRERGKVAES